MPSMHLVEKTVPETQAKRDLFSPRTNIKPYEYPDLLAYIDGIRHSYWLHTEFNYDPDIQDVKVNMASNEVESLYRTMLAISQIESSVKTFWGNIHHHIPKPEVAKVGATFSESEVRHEDAYSELLERLGLNDRFEKLSSVPCMRDRHSYISKVNNRVKGSKDPKTYFEAIIFFSMLIENVSLFSQFFIILSFNKFDNVLKGISNAVEATSKEEDIHANFGFDLINIIKEEHPDWWSDDLINRIYDIANKAYIAECKVLDWIYEDGDLQAAPRTHTEEFIKSRLNQSLVAIGLNPLFILNGYIMEQIQWFEDEVTVTKSNDFFQKRSTNYSKKTKATTAEDLF